MVSFEIGYGNGETNNTACHRDKDHRDAGALVYPNLKVSRWHLSNFTRRVP